MSYWFRPKRYGYGASPVNWKGWSVTAVYVVLLLAVTLATAGHLLLRFGAFAVLMALLIWIVWKKTDGTWRWGPDEKEK